ncbi:VOC family protein [Maribacter sp. 2307UL18-2]|uniref:VOC family protein n=1 Tax=Maribacter sp. 2307UL18-2 TaxID=3386274 RepID=UPI0039BD9320
MRFAHTNIISANWRELANFYMNTFDCKLVPPVRRQSGEWLDQGTGLKNAQLEGVHLLLPGHGNYGPTLEIYQYRSIDEREAVRPNTRGFGHIAFEVDHVEHVLQTLIQNGGQAFGQITEKEVPGVGRITFVYARDPEGNLIELQSWK